MGIEEPKAEALRLAPEVRAELARELLASLDTLAVEEVERLWVDEAIRRDEALDRGLAGACPADEVLTRIRSRRR